MATESFRRKRRRSLSASCCRARHNRAFSVFSETRNVLAASSVVSPSI